MKDSFVTALKPFLQVERSFTMKFIYGLLAKYTVALDLFMPLEEPESNQV